MITPTRRWISVHETAELIGLSVAGVRKKIARGEIPAVHLGRTVRIPVDKLEAMLDAQLKAGR
jgi:excisionase family DNA binding protein